MPMAWPGNSCSPHLFPELLECDAARFVPHALQLLLSVRALILGQQDDWRVSTGLAIRHRNVMPKDFARLITERQLFSQTVQPGAKRFIYDNLGHRFAPRV